MASTFVSRVSRALPTMSKVRQPMLRATTQKILLRAAMTSGSQRLIGSQGFDTPVLDAVPLTTLLSESKADTNLVIDYMRDEQIPEAYQMAARAAERGDNVGLDEYNEEFFKSLLERSQAFSIKRSPLGKPLGFFIVNPAHSYGRGLYLSNVETTILLSEEIWQAGSGSSGLLSQIIPGMEALVRSLYPRHTGCLIQVAINCSEWLQQLNHLGYTPTLCMPDSVNMVDFGLAENITLYKQLRDIDAMADNSEEHLPLAESLAISDSDYNELTLNGVAALPREVSINGHPFIMRNMQKGDDKFIYSLVKGAATKGIGFGVNQFPTLELFRGLHLAKTYFICLEDKLQPGKIALMFSFRNTGMVRTRKDKALSNGMILIAPEYRRLGLSGEVTPMIFNMAMEAGFTSMITHMVSSQAIFQRNRGQFGTRLVGSIPNGVCMAKPLGICDILVEYKNFIEAKPILEYDFSPLAKQKARA